MSAAAKRPRAKVLAKSLLRDRAERAARPGARVGNTIKVDRGEFDPFAVRRWRVVAGGDPGYLPKTPMRRGSLGWFITCGGCGREFESKGWAYCSNTCKRESAERGASRALMAEAGIDAPSKRRCECGCGRDIPKWKNGKRVSKVTRFFEPACKHKAWKARRAPSGTLATQNASAPPQNRASGGVLIGPSDFPINVIGGLRLPREKPNPLGRMRVRVWRS
jgi:hypothetical protein